MLINFALPNTVHCTATQGELTPLLHRLDKRNKPILPTLLKLRALVADWADGAEPRKDYKDYSRKQGASACAVLVCESFVYNHSR